MERIPNINADRLRWCCDQQGLTLEDLAEAARVPVNALQNAMSALPSLTVNQLRKIAEYFGRGVLFFLEAGAITDEQVHTRQFRTLHNQKPKLSAKVRRLVESVERQREIYLNLLEDLEDAPASPFTHPKGLLRDDAVQSAASARAWLGIAEQRSFPEYRAAVEAKGILIFRSNGYPGKWQIPRDDPVCGFTLIYQTHPIIFVKKHVAETRQTFTLMHELGHLLLHQDSFVDNREDLHSHAGKEREANAFAGNLLVPNEKLGQINMRARPENVAEIDEWIKPFRRDLGVSTEVVLRRLLDTGRLSQQTYEEYRQWKQAIGPVKSNSGSRVYRYREPIHLFGDNFVRTVLDSLHAKNITLNRASTYLDNIKIRSLRKLEGVYADH